MICKQCADAADAKAPKEEHCGRLDTHCTCAHRVPRDDRS